MLQEAVDFQAEVEELHGFLGTLTSEDWERETPFLGWTPWDVVAHLHFFDEVSLLSANDAQAFAERRTVLVKQMVAGVKTKQMQREEYGDASPQELMGRWRATARELAEALGKSAPARRLPWFGPDMGVRMFTTARYMETWAHAQDVYDLVRAPRTHTDRIKHIAVIGVRTFGWTFANRKLEPPGPPPYVRLEAPSGEIWEFGEPSETERVAGDAVEFCHVVTQGRNVVDTSLEVVGPVATRWMEIAQCFAGGPVDPPKPGERTWEGRA